MGDAPEPDRDSRRPRPGDTRPPRRPVGAGAARGSRDDASRRRVSSIHRRRRAALAVVLVALAGLSAALVTCGGESERLKTARAWVAAWERGDAGAMHRLLAADSRRRLTVSALGKRLREAATTATASGPVRALAVTETDAGARLRLQVPTRVFGVVRATTALPVGDDGVVWGAHLAFPGLRPGEALRPATELPPRAALLAADGSVLAEGPERTPDPLVADVAAETVGMVAAVPAADDAGDDGAIDADRAAALRSAGVPAGGQAGVNGLERALDDRLRGTPGGRLTAGGRLLAAQAPRASAPVRTTIVPAVVRTASAALAGRPGGAVAVDPRDGAVIGWAGTPFSGLGPPGSTFKIVTLVAALEAGIASERSIYPYEQQALLDGAPLQNADRELCGGTLTESFAHSCNSVFAPFGAQLGMARLADAAGRFGFGSPSDLPGAATSTVPAPTGAEDALTLGSTAIGQGDVRASALQIAAVTAVIARDGLRPRLTADGDRAAQAAAGRAPRPRRATTAAVAATVQEAMRAVVRDGTGGAAAIDGVEVAGKTGTAELGVTQTCPVAAEPDPALPACDEEDDPTDTDAWFAGYAPAGEGETPRAVVAVVLSQGGTGGATAAPVARELLLTALARDDAVAPAADG